MMLPIASIFFASTNKFFVAFFCCFQFSVLISIAYKFSWQSPSIAIYTYGKFAVCIRTHSYIHNIIHIAFYSHLYACKQCDDVMLTMTIICLK